MSQLPRPNSKVSTRSSTLRRSRPFPWWGLVLMVVGAGLIVIYNQRPSLWAGPWAKAIYPGLGSLLILWGLWTIAHDVGQVRSRSSRDGWTGYHVRMPAEAAVFLGIMIVLFLGALLGKANMLVLVFGLLAGPFVLNGSITLTMLRKTRCHRVVPERASAGDVFSVDLTLYNGKRWFASWMMEVHDSLRSAREHLQPAILFTRVPPKSQRTGSYQLRLAYRGLYELGPLQVSSRFPMGMMERVVDVGDVQQLIVYPQVGHLTTLWHHSSSFNNELVTQPRSRKGAFDDEFHQLREYRRGDNPRAIHWRTTARRNTLMVREFHQNRDQDLQLIVDLYLPDRPTPQELARVETAVSFAATVCLEHCRQAGESRLSLGVSGRTEQEWQGLAGALAIDPVLELLGLVEAGPAMGLNHLCDSLESRLEGPTRRVLISTRGSAVTPAAKSSNGAGLHAAAPLQVIAADQFAEYFFMADE